MAVSDGVVLTTCTRPRPRRVGPGAWPGRPMVFLDKDGTLIRDVPYNVDPRRIRLAPGADGGVRALHGAGYPLVVVSNQSGVARGLFPEAALDEVTRRLRILLGVLGVPLVDALYCPHDPAGVVDAYRVACGCRKPAPGLLTTAAAAHGADLARSWMIGDILDDVEAGARAGCRTILLDTGAETEWRDGVYRRPDHRARDLAQAAEIVIAAASAAAGSR